MASDCKSMLQRNKICYVCGATRGLHRHHVMFGSSRKAAEKYNLCLYLCYEHHEGNTGVHHNRALDLELKKFAQEVFEEKYNHETWMQVFGKNFL